MQLFADGLSVLISNWQIVFFILVVIIINQFIIASTIKQSCGEELSSAEYFSISTAGWLLPAFGMSLLWYVLKAIPLAQWIVFCTTLILISYLLYTNWKAKKLQKPSPTSWFLASFLVLSIILRLAFISKTIFPLYFDSAQHYLYIKNLLGNVNAIHWLTTSYYHLGFHFLTAFITTITGVNISDVMLFLGQLFLAIIPISFFFIIKHETGSNNAGIFSIFLAGFGWYMPAHVMDWGKYPALTSLLLIQFVLSIAYLSTQAKTPLKSRIILNTVLILSTLLSIFFHSRSVIIFGFFILAWILASWAQKLRKSLQIITTIVVIVGISAEAIYIQNHSVLRPLLDPYINKGLWITITVLLLIFFAIRVHPKLTLFNLVMILLLLGSVFIPVWIPNYGNMTILDRPFVEMILYLPLSLLGGLGLAGLLHQITQWKSVRFSLDKVIGPIFIVLVIINMSVNYNFYPSDCCKIIGSNDLTAIDWLDKNLPSDARIAISTTELVVLPSAVSQGNVGADAGIWIFPLTNRVTVPLPYNSSFDQKETVDVLCAKSINYIYVGETGQPFDDAKLNTHPEWYKMLLAIQKVGIYQVIGCK